MVLACDPQQPLLRQACVTSADAPFYAQLASGAAEAEREDRRAANGGWQR